MQIIAFEGGGIGPLIMILPRASTHLNPALVVCCRGDETRCCRCHCELSRMRVTCRECTTTIDVVDLR